MESRYPNRDRLLDVIQEAGLKRSGLVASCILPEVQTGTNFEWIDWATTPNFDGKFDNLKQTDDLVGCTSQVKEIDPSSFKYIQGKTTEKALQMYLKQCHASACTPTGALPFNVDAAKTEELVDRILLNREIRVINAVTNEALYTAAVNPATESSEGAVFNLLDAGQAGATGLNNTSFDLLKYFQLIQEDNFATGMRNKAVMSLSALHALIRHPSFRPTLSQTVLSTMDEIKAFLGVQEICIADSALNTALPGAAYAMNRIWGNYILLTKSIEVATPDSQRRGFGFSAYSKPLSNRIWFDDKAGSEGSDVQVVYHDLTEVIADIKSATLIKI